MPGIASLRTILFIVILVGRTAPAQVLINTVAGGGSDDGIPAVQAHLISIASPVLVDSGGSVYFSENSQIRKITPNGLLHTIAGTGITGFSGDGGPAVSAQLAHPGQIAIDGQGNIFFPDNGRIRSISPNGTISTVAGNGLPATSVTNGLALSIPLDFVDGIVADSHGNVFIAEPLSERIREIKPDGTISLFAGAGTAPGSDGNGGQAILASLSAPILAGIDSADNIYLYEGTEFLNPGQVYRGGTLIRKISSAGIISTVAGTLSSVGTPIVIGQSAVGTSLYQLMGAVASTSGTVYLSVETTNSGGVNTMTDYSITSDSDIHLLTGIGGLVLGTDTAGNIYYSGSSAPGIAGTTPTSEPALFLVSPAGASRLVAGGSTYAAPDGTQARSAFIDPSALALDSTGHVIFAEWGSCLIRRIGDDGSIHTLAGTGSCSSASSITGPALSTALPPIQSVAIGPDGTIYFGDALTLTASAIYSISPKGQVSQFVSGYASSLAVDSKGNVFAASTHNNEGEGASCFNPQGQVTVRVGFGFPNFLAGAIALDSSDHPYVFNGSNNPGGGNYVLLVGQPNCVIAGFPTNLLAYYGPSTAGAVDSAGNVYFNVLSSGLYRSVGGQAPPLSIGNFPGFSGDGGPAQSAFYNTPGAMAAGSNGQIFFVDRGNFRIRTLTGSLPATPPSILPNGVVNSASYKGGTISAGELVSIFGANLAPATVVNSFSNNLLPEVAGNTRVFFNQVRALILAATPGQINAIVPQYFNNIVNPASIQIEVDSVLSQPISMPIAPASPGLFTADSSGSGPGSIVNGDGTINSATNPAARGSILSLYGTGAGTMIPQLADGYLNLSAPFGMVDGLVTATVAGQRTTVPYAGGAPFLVAGAFQMNVLLPMNIPPGAVDLVISIASVPSNHVSVWTK